MKNNNDMLTEKTKLALDLSKEERINFLNEPVWIHYDRAQSILDKMEELLRMPSTPRMPSMMIISRTNNGKTNLALKFLNQHKVDINPGNENIIAPVLFIEAPPTPSERGLHVEILRTLYEKIPASSDEARRAKVVEVLKKIQTRVLIIDELHNSLTGSSSKQHVLLNALKYLSNTLRISIIACGTEQLKVAMSTDPQIENRFKPYILPVWKADKEYQQLLRSFEQKLPLKFTSNLYSPALARKIHALSEGTIGETANLLKDAAKYAIQQDIERIDSDVLDKCGYQSPSVRRKNELKV